MVRSGSQGDYLRVSECRPATQFPTTHPSDINGRNYSIGRIVRTISHEQGSVERFEKNHRALLKAVYDTRVQLLQTDSHMIWKLEMSKNLRIGVKTRYSYGKYVSVWLPTLRNGTDVFGFRTNAAVLPLQKAATD